MFYKPLFLTVAAEYRIHGTCGGTEHNTQESIHKWQKIETVSGANRTAFTIRCGLAERFRKMLFPKQEQERFEQQSIEPEI